jgi:hypothetical protein
MAFRWLIVGFLLNGALTGDVAARAQALRGERVFVCGHSFHVFIAEPLERLARETGYSGHRTVGTHFLGNSRPIRHWNVADDQNPVKRALAAGEVDVLTLAPHREVPDEGIDRFADLAIAKNPEVRVMLQCSWSPFDGKPEAGFAPGDRDQVTLSDLKRMALLREVYLTVLRAQARAINERHGRSFVTLVPVGSALSDLRAAIIAGTVPGLARQSELFKDSNGHGTPPLQHLATYCWFAAVYGRSPVGMRSLETEGDANSRALHRRLQEIAWAAVQREPSSGVKPGGPAR